MKLKKVLRMIDHVSNVVIMDYDPKLEEYRPVGYVKAGNSRMFSKKMMNRKVYCIGSDDQDINSLCIYLD